jgi:hypothetical protein
MIANVNSFTTNTKRPLSVMELQMRELKKMIFGGKKQSSSAKTAGDAAASSDGKVKSKRVDNAGVGDNDDDDMVQEEVEDEGDGGDEAETKLAAAALHPHHHWQGMEVVKAWTEQVERAAAPKSVRNKNGHEHRKKQAGVFAVAGAATLQPVATGGKGNSGGTGNKLPVAAVVSHVVHPELASGTGHDHHDGSHAHHLHLQQNQHEAEEAIRALEEESALRREMEQITAKAADTTMYFFNLRVPLPTHDELRGRKILKNRLKVAQQAREDHKTPEQVRVAARGVGISVGVPTSSSTTKHGGV